MVTLGFSTKIAVRADTKKDQHNPYLVQPFHHTLS